MNPRRIFLSLLVVVIISSLNIPALAQHNKGDEPETHQLVGSWQSTFSAIPGNPVQFPDLPALFTFNSDNTLTEIDGGLLVPAPPGAFGNTSTLYASPAHGIWRKIGDRKYEFKLVSIIVNGADGTLFATGTLQFTVQLSADGDRFSAKGTFKFVDTNGNTLPGAAGPETISGRRIEF
jgi:hypothetical protein